MPVTTETPLSIHNVPEFWERLSATPVRFLGLDYDGTLAPFHVDPMQAKPLAGASLICFTLFSPWTRRVWP